MVAEPKLEWRTGARILAGSLCGVALVVCVLTTIVGGPFSAGRSSPAQVAFSDAGRSVSLCELQRQAPSREGARWL